MAVDIETIEEAIILADSYSFDLTEELRAEQLKGCDDCCDVALIESLIELTYMLERRIYRSEPLLDEVTDNLYTCLQTKLISYAGAGGTINPNASIPNVLIDVTIVGNNSPYEIQFGYEDFVDSGVEARVRYENPYWVDWLPILEVDNVTLNFGQEGVPDDYAPLATGGFVLLPNGNIPAIYPTQIITTVGYRPYTVFVTPPVITVQPQSQTIITGQPFALNFTGSNYYFIQWQKDNEDIEGATSPTFEVESFSLEDQGSYTVVLSNGNATLESSPAIITSASSAVQIFNKSDRKSDGTPNGAGRNVFLQFDGGGTLLSVGANTTIPPGYTTTVNFKQAGGDNLTLSINGVLYPILGGDVDNIFPIEDFDPFLNNIYNNN